MLILSFTGIFLAGMLTGFYGRKHRETTNSVTIPIDTFNYLVERDNELWEIEKKERAAIKFPSLKDDCEQVVNSGTTRILN